MAANLSLTQLSSGNPIYEKYYRQADPANTGRVSASDAAVFLKKSGLADLVLGKIWDLADGDKKGFLNKREFFIALRLVACAQCGTEVSLSSLNSAVPPPKFHDTSSPLLIGGAVPDVPWAVKVEEKAKYDTIFDSLGPVNGFLSGDKVKPVLLNSKLPVDVLGRVWELSDIDRDGLLDKDEFAVAMYLVYRALEKEPVPMSLPHGLVPLSKRKKLSVANAVPLIPSPPSAREVRQSLPSGGTLHSKPPPLQWVVSPADKTKYDEIFMKTDKDKDGYVSGLEVKDIFLKTGLPAATLAHIWSLCDTKDCGKLSKEQFALALHFINQKLTKGIDPPQVLTADMIPPADRANGQKNSGELSLMDFSAIKELDSLNNEIADLHREKSNVEQEIKEREETIKQRTSEVQDLQDEVEKENSNLQKLQTQRQEVQEVLDGLDQQKSQLEEQLNDIRKQCTEENQLILSLKAEVESQETKISSYLEELNKAREELSQLQQEAAELEECVEAGKSQLEPLQQSIQDTQQELSVVQTSLLELKESESHINNQLSWHSHSQSALVNGLVEHCSLSNSNSEAANLNEIAEAQSPGEAHSPEEPEPVDHEAPARNSPEAVFINAVEEKEEIPDTDFTNKEDHFDVKSNAVLPPVQDSNLDFFRSDPFTGSDPFKDDPFGKVDPFGGDPFKGTDPFASDSFFKQPSTDPFASSDSDPFSTGTSNTGFSSTDAVKSNDPFAPGGTTVAVATDAVADPFASLFGNDSFGGGFADFSTLSKSSSADPFSATTTGPVLDEYSSKITFTDEPVKSDEVPPALPPKTITPTRPPPPPPGRLSITKSQSSDSKLTDPSQMFNSGNPLHKDPQDDPFAPSSPSKEAGDSTDFANFSTYPTEDDMIEWVKRESEREEEERLARLNQQEQEDLELAIALSKSELSEA
ncbi:epidermal growth factor receptor substrate 15 isoform X2 [Latimeria chalumnae]|uniref:epidermal growth factor receptor substrate 15 isoform X2 n=1 Tax=Latimeria chalumnae TaxID=7897 RepID=UPI00313DC1A7